MLFTIFIIAPFQLGNILFIRLQEIILNNFIFKKYLKNFSARYLKENIINKQKIINKLLLHFITIISQQKLL